jgi:hypothetical protein
MDLKTAIGWINADYSEARNAIGLISPVIRSGEDLCGIERETLRIVKDNDRVIFWRYNIGTKVINEHCTALLRGKLGFNDIEEELLRRVIGLVEANPPKSEVRRRAMAAEELNAKGGRGMQVLDALKEEAAGFNKLVKQVNRELKTDMFHNPILNLGLTVVRFPNFKEVADCLWELADRRREISYTEK